MGIVKQAKAAVVPYNIFGSSLWSTGRNGRQGKDIILASLHTHYVLVGRERELEVGGT